MSRFWSCCLIVPLVASTSSKLGSKRWFYIFIQGIGLGLTLDVGQMAVFSYLTKLVVKLECHETLEAYQNAL